MATAPTLGCFGGRKRCEGRAGRLDFRTSHCSRLYATATAGATCGKNRRFARRTRKRVAYSRPTTP